MNETDLKQRTKAFALRIMELIIDGELLKKPLVESLLTEASELTAIMVASQKHRSVSNQEFVEARSMTHGCSRPSNPKSKIANQKC